MYEVEVKVPAAHGPVRDRLADLGAEPRGTVHQRDTYYHHPGRDFAETDETLRLRRVTSVDDGASERAVLTYKGPLVDDRSKTREEVETGVDDPGATDAILRAVGFEPAADVEKARERYALEGYEVVLDDVADLGAFVEVEAVGEAADVDALREGAVALLHRLGLDPDEGITRSYLGLLLDAA